ncbi:MAG: hypothetical protein ACM3UL_04055 [Ignavibacteria bacterium]
MKQATVLAATTVLALSVLVAAFINFDNSNKNIAPSNQAPFHVGVSFCGDTTAEAKLLIDRVENYTNLFVIQSGPVSKNQTSLNEIADYATDRGLDIIVFFGWLDRNESWQIPWLDYATQRFGNQFLGIYYYDEPGGIQLDIDNNEWAHFFNSYLRRYENSSLYRTHSEGINQFINGTLTRNYESAARVYVDSFKRYSDLQELHNRSIPIFTSDYALYWYTYKGGWDVLLTQLGWNISVQQDIALARGAAKMQNNEWGAMITWKYDEPPYIDTGDEIYKQMQMAYTAGANYIVIFNFPQNDTLNPYGVMKDEHFSALQNFWNDIRTQKILHGSSSGEVAFVLPENYGWGMRRPDDKIWYWGPDELSPQIWNTSRQLISQYGLRLDFIYNDPQFPLGGNYSRVYYWNQTL